MQFSTYITQWSLRSSVAVGRDDITQKSLRHSQSQSLAECLLLLQMIQQILLKLCMKYPLINGLLKITPINCKSLIKQIVPDVLGVRLILKGEVGVASVGCPGSPPHLPVRRDTSASGGSGSDVPDPETRKRK